MALAHQVAVPKLFFVPIGVAVAVQIGTTAAGLAGAGAAAGWLLVAGVAAFFVVSAVQLARFRRLNGVWLGGLVSRVIGGTATAACLSYTAALAGAVWAAFADAWWLVPLLAAAGGAAYVLSGRAWMRTYRSAPATHSRGESAPWLAASAVLALTGLLLLVSLR